MAETDIIEIDSDEDDQQQNDAHCTATEDQYDPYTFKDASATEKATTATKRSMEKVMSGKANDLLQNFSIEWDAPQRVNLASSMVVNVNVNVTNNTVGAAPDILRDTSPSESETFTGFTSCVQLPGPISELEDSFHLAEQQRDSILKVTAAITFWEENYYRFLYSEGNRSRLKQKMANLMKVAMRLPLSSDVEKRLSTLFDLCDGALAAFNTSRLARSENVTSRLRESILKKKARQRKKDQEKYDKSEEIAPEKQAEPHPVVEAVQPVKKTRGRVAGYLDSPPLSRLKRPPHRWRSDPNDIAHALLQAFYAAPQTGDTEPGDEGRQEAISDNEMGESEVTHSDRLDPVDPTQCEVGEKKNVGRPDYRRLQSVCFYNFTPTTHSGQVKATTTSTSSKTAANTSLLRQHILPTADTVKGETSGHVNKVQKVFFMRRTTNYQPVSSRDRREAALTPPPYDKQNSSPNKAAKRKHKSELSAKKRKRRLSSSERPGELAPRALPSRKVRLARGAYREVLSDDENAASTKRHRGATRSSSGRRRRSRYWRGDSDDDSWGGDSTSGSEDTVDGVNSGDDAGVTSDNEQDPAGRSSGYSFSGINVTVQPILRANTPPAKQPKRGVKRFNLTSATMVKVEKMESEDDDQGVRSGSKRHRSKELHVDLCDSEDAGRDVTDNEDRPAAHGGDSQSDSVPQPLFLLPCVPGDSSAELTIPANMLYSSASFSTASVSLTTTALSSMAPDTCTATVTSSASRVSADSAAKETAVSEAGAKGNMDCSEGVTDGGSSVRVRRRETVSAARTEVAGRNVVSAEKQEAEKKDEGGCYLDSVIAELFPTDHHLRKKKS